MGKKTPQAIEMEFFFPFFLFFFFTVCIIKKKKKSPYIGCKWTDVQVRDVMSVWLTRRKDKWRDVCNLRLRPTNPGPAHTDDSDP